MQKRIVLHNSDNIILTDDQTQSLEIISLWYKTKDLFLCLNGSAGTGKTTLAKYFIQREISSSVKCCVSAPTHQAKEVISKKTGLQGFTVHKLLGIRMDLDIADFDPDNPVYDVKGVGELFKFDIVILDEASMINTKLYNHLLKKCKKENVKILFLGDELQLNPVGEKVSPVFKENDVTTLTEIVRQVGDNPLLDIFTVLRNDIENNTENYLKLLTESKTTNSGGYKIYPISNAVKKKEFASTCVEHFNDPLNNNKILTWTRKNVDSWNVAVKGKVNPSETVVTIGDTIVGATNIYKNNELILTNSSSYRIINAVDHVRRVVGITVHSLRVTCVNAYLDRPVQFNIVKPESYGVYTSILLDKKDKAKRQGKRGWVNYYNFKADFLIADDLITSHGNVVDTRSFTLGYSSTVHKSQGSTYENTFVIASNIRKNRDIAERNRLMYVALSRTSKTSHIYI